jgi:hypothetical protein
MVKKRNVLETAQEMTRRGIVNHFLRQSRQRTAAERTKPIPLRWTQTESGP